MSFMNIKEESRNLASQIVEKILCNKVYNTFEVQQWTGQVCEAVQNSLKELKTDMKYTVTCIIM